MPNPLYANSILILQSSIDLGYFIIPYICVPIARDIAKHNIIPFLNGSSNNYYLPFLIINGLIPSLLNHSSTSYSNSILTYFNDLFAFSLLLLSILLLRIQLLLLLLCYYFYDRGDKLYYLVVVSLLLLLLLIDLSTSGIEASSKLYY